MVFRFKFINGFLKRNVNLQLCNFFNRSFGGFIGRIINKFFKITILLIKDFNKFNINIFYSYSKINIEIFNKGVDKFTGIHELYKKNSFLLNPSKIYKFDLGFIIFVDVAYSLIPFLEKNNIPFIFVLYPGGGFSINSRSSRLKLRRIFKSSLFRGVIVTNNLSRKYLIDNKMCNIDTIFLKKHETPNINIENIKRKKRYLKEKNTFDLVFVAHKYCPGGIDKGYDLFIETAKVLVKKHKCMRFHVVGDFSENDIDIFDIKDKILFYGIKDSNFLADLYSKMDIFLTPNRPFILSNGSFDGFPIGLTHAQFCGVAIFSSDELNLNTTHSSEEIVIIKNEVNDIVEKIEKYLFDLDSLYKLSLRGQMKSHYLCNEDEMYKELFETINRVIN